MMKQSTGIGILIRNRRKELGMNQAELSKRSTLSQAHVSRIEAGISYPSVFTILKLAKGLQLPPEALIAAAESHEKAGARDEKSKNRFCHWLSHRVQFTRQRHLSGETNCTGRRICGVAHRL